MRHYPRLSRILGKNSYRRLGPSGPRRLDIFRSFFRFLLQKSDRYLAKSRKKGKTQRCKPLNRGLQRWVLGLFCQCRLILTFLKKSKKSEKSRFFGLLAMRVLDFFQKVLKKVQNPYSKKPKKSTFLIFFEKSRLFWASCYAGFGLFSKLFWKSTKPA